VPASSRASWNRIRLEKTESSKALVRSIGTDVGLGVAHPPQEPFTVYGLRLMIHTSLKVLVDPVFEARVVSDRRADRANRELTRNLGVIKLSANLGVLLATAATIGVLHTALGPDHYVPFITIANARSWSMRRTAAVTVMCGLGHVLSSIILGAVGLSIGTALFRLEAIEAVRGQIAGWLLFAFGFMYLIYGARKAIKNRPHVHSHSHLSGHLHRHVAGHSHPHVKESRKLNVWILFVIFVFGPCEPLIPLLIFPAAEGGITTAIVIALVFAVTTITTMTAMVLVGAYGLSLFRIKSYSRYGHAAAGAAITVSGALVLFAGL